MKFFFLVLLVVLSVAAKETKSEINLNVTHGGLLSTTIVQHVLVSMGYKAHINRFSSVNEVTEMDMILYGKKPLDPKEFVEESNLHQITASNAIVSNKKWTIGLDASQALWNVPAITQDEGVQIERTNIAAWFRVNNTLGITVEAPYGNNWYPEIAVLDDKMQTLLSTKESTFKDRITFQLPEHAMYLKVSNSNGMKMLREGMWIESANEEQ
ncbi:MAG TPA: hypothetical protein PLM93_06425 [Sulfuricurvum sp.]|nr:MAG: hypothetical protein B7Y30_05595 [Campylobacterales bacterium 16-40-21]OZA02539.1 MAG: hypothetical protein B7X89_08770 [Sulfuricurvum sp. 17-40-25]HQS66801.1 hypothetical protein [Sulfuricurvum sp.]HQT36962.1 hypothetical protein [Sulfuricurvum sp.]